MGWFCSLCFPVLFILAVGLPIGIYTGYFGWQWLRQRRIRARALREACMICDADVNEALDGTYQCSACGFDVSWQEQSERKAQVEEARELRIAVSEFQMGLDEMERAVMLAKANVWGLGSTDLKYVAMEKAEGHFVEGHRMLDRLIRNHPELGDFPFPTVLLADLSHDDRDKGGVLGLMMFGIKARVRDQMIDAYQQAQGSVAVLEGTLIAMGEELQGAS